MGQFNAELTEAGAMVTGAGLQERATGTTVHYSERRSQSSPTAPSPRPRSSSPASG